MSDVARILSARALLYADGADAASDRPAYVRAASGLCWARAPEGPRLIVCQDDAAFVGVLEPATGAVRALALPAGPGGFRQFDILRNNKMDKLDLEAACAVQTPRGERVWLIGSGSAPVREVLLELDLHATDGAPRVVSLAPLCDALRDHPALRGAELNLEGACVHGAELLLLQRGNGAGGVNALVRVPLEDVHAWVAGGASAPCVAVTPVELPRVVGVPLTFTDAEPWADGRVMFLAAAEASPNAIDDGEVVGCGVGLLRVEPSVAVEAWAPLVEASGAPSVRKPEGIAWDAERAGFAWLVVDMDDPGRPSELCEVELPRWARR